MTATQLNLYNKAPQAFILPHVNGLLQTCSNFRVPLVCTSTEGDIQASVSELARTCSPTGACVVFDLQSELWPASNIYKILGAFDRSLKKGDWILVEHYNARDHFDTLDALIGRLNAHTAHVMQAAAVDPASATAHTKRIRVLKLFRLFISVDAPFDILDLPIDHPLQGSARLPTLVTSVGLLTQQFRIIAMSRLRAHVDPLTANAVVAVVDPSQPVGVDFSFHLSPDGKRHPPRAGLTSLDELAASRTQSMMQSASQLSSLVAIEQPDDELFPEPAQLRALQFQLFESIRAGSTANLRRIIHLRVLDVNNIVDDSTGLLPLSLAIKLDRLPEAKVLLEAAHADPNISLSADSTVPPPLFCGIKSVGMVKLLIDFDAAVFGAKFGAHTLVGHPDTPSDVKAYLTDET